MWKEASSSAKSTCCAPSSIAAAAAAGAFMLSSSQHSSRVEVEVYEAVELCEDDNDRTSRRIMERNLVGKKRGAGKGFTAVEFSVFSCRK